VGTIEGEVFGKSKSGSIDSSWSSSSVDKKNITKLEMRVCSSCENYNARCIVRCKTIEYTCQNSVNSFAQDLFTSNLPLAMNMFLPL